MLDQLDFERMDSNKAAKEKAGQAEEVYSKAQTEAEAATNVDDEGANGAGAASGPAQAPTQGKKGKSAVGKKGQAKNEGEENVGTGGTTQA